MSSNRTGAASCGDVLCGGKGRVIRAPNGSPTAAIAFMHGLGDTCDGVSKFFPLVEHADVVLPSADMHPVVIIDGMRMSS